MNEYARLKLVAQWKKERKTNIETDKRKRKIKGGKETFCQRTFQTVEEYTVRVGGVAGELRYAKFHSPFL